MSDTDKVVCAVCGSDNVNLFTVSSIRTAYQAVVKGGKVVTGDVIDTDIDDFPPQMPFGWCEECETDRQLVIADGKTRETSKRANPSPPPTPQV